MALVTLLKHSHRVPALLSACLPLQPPSPGLRVWGGGGAPRPGAFAQQRCQASWWHQFLSSAGVQMTWDQVSPRDAPQPVPQEGLGNNFVIVLTLLI